MKKKLFKISMHFNETIRKKLKIQEKSKVYLKKKLLISRLLIALYFKIGYKIKALIMVLNMIPSVLH